MATHPAVSTPSRLGSRIGHVLLYAALIAGAVLILLPFAYMLSTSLKSLNEVFHAGAVDSRGAEVGEFFHAAARAPDRHLFQEQSDRGRQRDAAESAHLLAGGLLVRQVHLPGTRPDVLHRPGYADGSPGLDDHSALHGGQESRLGRHLLGADPAGWDERLRHLPRCAST